MITVAGEVIGGLIASPEHTPCDIHSDVSAIYRLILPSDHKTDILDICSTCYNKFIEHHNASVVSDIL
jgi:hypothetical protein